jgi:hypothetical protein
MATYENPLAKFQTDNILTGRTEIESNITGTASVPIGAVLSWLKSLTGTPGMPDGWVECNGQTLNDTNSPYNGQTIPDLNGYTGTQRFLRGGGSADGATATASGGTGGSETSAHSHTLKTSEGYNLAGGTGATDWGYGILEYDADIPSPWTTESGSTAIIPPYYGVVWIMRVR